MSSEANLEAYLKRINYAGSIAPTLQTLEMVHRLHPAAIPFENLNPLMELPVRLQLSDIEQKLIVERRGGYCFEQNLLFKAVLEAMDYAVTGRLAAGVLWGHEDGYVPPMLNHMALLVDVGGIPYLADVGFGGQVATAPLRLRADVEQTTPNERYRLSGGHPKWRARGERDRRRNGSRSTSSTLDAADARRLTCAANDAHAWRLLPRRSGRGAGRGRTSASRCCNARLQHPTSRGNDDDPHADQRRRCSRSAMC